MKTGLMFAGALSAALFLAWSADGQPPQGGEKKEGGKGGFQKGGFPGKGGFGGGMRPGQILPSFMQDALKLTDEQKQKVADLQKDVDAKLDTILTAEQKDQLKQMRERGPGGPGGKDGKDGPGGKGGKGGPPKKDTPPSE
jgi:Spy/CpxP family protein refolding chaperone